MNSVISFQRFLSRSTEVSPHSANGGLSPLSSDPKALKAFMFQELMDWLHQNAIRYVILGNSSGYPDTLEGDLDLVIQGDQLKGIISKLATLETASFNLVQVIQHEPDAYYLTLVALPKNPEEAPVYLHPDLCSDYWQQGHRLLSAEMLLTDARRSEKGFWIPRPAMAFAYYFLKSVRKQALSPERLNYLMVCYHEAPEEALNEIRPFFSEAMMTAITQATQTNEWSFVADCLPLLLSELEVHAPRSSQDWWAITKLFVKRILNPTGLWVAFVGPDGSGKSTVLSAIEAQLKPAFRAYLWQHLRPQLRQPFTRETLWVETNPHGKPPRPLWFSFMKILWFWGEAYIAFAAKVYPKLVSSTLLVYDRFFPDFVVDPKRFRYEGPLWLPRLLAESTPQPDQVLVFLAKPETLLDRKAEVSPEECHRQFHGYHAWADQHTNTFLVNTDMPESESIRQTVCWLLAILQERTRKRYSRESLW